MTDTTQEVPAPESGAGRGLLDWKIRYFEPDDIEFIDTGRGIIHAATSTVAG